MLVGDFTYNEGTMNDRAFLNMMDSRWRMIYPAPFFDPIAMQTIADPKILIQWSIFFYDWHPIIHAAINKMVTYPITDFIYDTTDKKLRANYEKAFEILNIRELLIRAGLDYFVSGNVFLSPIMPFKRMLECPKCSYLSSVEAASVRVTGQGMTMVCNGCSASVEPKIQDISTQSIEDMRLILWNPLNMQVDYDEVMNTSEYYYSLPNYIKVEILKGNKKYLERYPMYFMEAARKKKLIRIYSDKVMHMKRETHSASYYKGWGQPLITPVLKYLFHLLLLLRSQDALAIDQILPWTVLSPAPNGGTDPAIDTDLTNWKNQVIDEYGRWKKNPLHKSIMPIPMNSQIIGAQGRALMLTPEIEAITNQILAGMGVPNEFVYGGLQWSGASVSLRMLENQFINYRTMMQRILDWVVDQISIYFGYAPIPIKMQNFKMADDVAQKQVFTELANSQIISQRTLLNEIMPHIDFDKEQERIEKEQLDKLKLHADLQRNQQQAGFMLMDPYSAAEHGGGGDGGSGGGPRALPEQRPPRSEGGNKQI